MHITSDSTIQPHNQRAAAVWSAGGKGYDQISRGIADSIEHCVLRLAPRPGERILDLSTGTGWTSRLVARSGARVTGVDIADGLLEVARATAAAEGLAIDYRLGDAEDLPSTTARSTRSSPPAASCSPAGRKRRRPNWRGCAAKGGGSPSRRGSRTATSSRCSP